MKNLIYNVNLNTKLESLGFKRDGRSRFCKKADESILEIAFSHSSKGELHVKYYYIIQRYGIPSLIDAAGDSDHDYHATEQDANIRAFKYFMKHEPNFEKADGPRWDKRYNPIKGYDWSKPIDSPANQLVLKKGTMSLGWADYVFGPSILIPGFFNVFQLMQ